MNFAGKGRGRRGQTLVEAALLLLVFFVIITGVVDVGQMLFLHETLTERAQAAVRWGVTNPYDPASVTNLVLYGTTSPDPSAQPLGGLDTSNVTVSNPGCGPNLNIDCRVTVVVSGYTYKMYSAAIIGTLLGGSGDPTYSGQTIQVSLPSEVLNATQ